MAREVIAQQERFENFGDLMVALQTKYTLSFKAACKALKSSRSWVNNYIRPFVPCVYISNGYGKNRINYLEIISRSLREEFKDNIYFDEESFNAFVSECVVKCQKRSKRVHIGNFVPEEKQKAYYRALMRCSREVTNLNKKETEEKFRKVYDKYVPNYTDFEKNILHSHRRTEGIWIDVDLPKVPISSWEAVHDLMDYGDTEEPHYRRLFAQGYIKVELAVPSQDEDKKDSKKVFYIKDPSPCSSPNEYNHYFNELVSDRSVNANSTLDTFIEHDIVIIQEGYYRQIFPQVNK